LAVTTFALLGIVSTIRVTSRANIDSQRATEAESIAEGMIETLRGLSVLQFETATWAHVADGRLANEPASNCPHANLPYGPITSTTITGSETSWFDSSAGGGCDDGTWREWHEGPIRGATNVEFRRGVRFGVVEADLVWIQVIVEWTNEGARAGAFNGRYDRSITMETVRSRLETPP
ncbi:MAG: hypothetical protein KBG15_10340, partial [Kofleriaceae bacterium]|nr:hypothetical protein [Kofleriaceae bacterium]